VIHVKTFNEFPLIHTVDVTHAGQLIYVCHDTRSGHTQYTHIGSVHPDLIGITLDPDQIKLSASDKLAGRARTRFIKSHTPLFSAVETALSNASSATGPSDVKISVAHHLRVMSLSATSIKSLRPAAAAAPHTPFLLYAISNKGWESEAMRFHLGKTSSEAFKKMMQRYTHREKLKAIADLSVWVPACHVKRGMPTQWMDAATRSVLLDTKPKPGASAKGRAACVKVRDGIYACAVDSITDFYANIVFSEQYLSRLTKSLSGTLRRTRIRKRESVLPTCPASLKK